MKCIGISVAIMVFFIISSVSTKVEAEEKPMSLFEQLKSERLEDRQVAAEVLIKQRNQSIQQAELIIKEFVNLDDRKGTVKTSILLLGKLQAQQSIPLLLEHLTFEVFYKDVKRPQSIEDRFPCVQALIDIGLSSVDPLVEKVRNSTDSKVIGCAAKVMYRVLGKGPILDYVNQKVKNESDSLKKKRLLDLLNVISVEE